LNQKGTVMLIDISPPINEALAVWPGDVPFSRSINNDMATGDLINLTSFETTSHLGAHIDAERHYVQDGRDITEWPLDRFVGQCEVVQVAVSRGERVRPEQLPDTTASRVLIRTDSHPDPNIFNEDFAGLHPDTVDLLASRDVYLIGVDTPSVDCFHETALPSHQRCAAGGITILEGLVLTRFSVAFSASSNWPMSMESALRSEDRCVSMKASVAR
jgi:arylformamidase